MSVLIPDFYIGITKNPPTIVNIGKTIVIKVDDMEEATYTIVGSLEANPLQGRISNESPIVLLSLRPFNNS